MYELPSKELERMKRFFVMLLDFCIGVLLGCFAYYNSSRRDVILTELHRYGNVLHMDVLTNWTIWLKGIPMGLKLNDGFAFTSCLWDHLILKSFFSL